MMLLMLQKMRLKVKLDYNAKVSEIEKNILLVLIIINSRITYLMQR